MAVAFNAFSRVTDGFTSSKSWSHTCSGSNRYLLVFISYASGTDYTTGVTFNGAAMTRLLYSVNGARSAVLYGLVAPAAATANIIASFGASISVDLAAMSFTGVHQSAPTVATPLSEILGFATSPRSVSTGAGAAADGMGAAFITATDDKANLFTAPSGETIAVQSDLGAQLLAAAYKAGATSMGWAWPGGATKSIGHIVVGLAAAVVPGDLGGNVDLSAAVAGGTLASSASDLGGNVDLVAAVAADTLGTTPGVITSDPLRDKFTGALQAGLNIPKIAIVRVSDMAAVLTLVDTATNGAGRLVITNAALVPGVKYLLVTCNSDGSAYGAEVYTAA